MGLTPKGDWMQCLARDVQATLSKHFHPCSFSMGLLLPEKETCCPLDLRSSSRKAGGGGVPGAKGNQRIPPRIPAHALIPLRRDQLEDGWAAWEPQGQEDRVIMRSLSYCFCIYSGL